MTVHIPLGTKPDLASDQWERDAYTNTYRPSVRPQMTRSQDAWCRRNIKGYADLQDAMKKRPTQDWR